MATKTRALDAPASPPSLSAVLRQLQDQKLTLDKLDDRIAAAISKVEDVMRHYVGIRTSTVMHQWEVDELECLTFGKVRNQWHLLIERGRIDQDGDFAVKSTTQLSDCTRQKRAEVFAEGHLDTLLRTAHSKFEAEITNRSQAVMNAEQILAALSNLALPESPPASSGTDDDIPF
jgi:hypothetical protein